MAYRARVTLSGDPSGMHARPAAEVGRAIAGFDAEIVFSQGERRYQIDTGAPSLSLLAASGTLGLQHGSDFEVTCDGAEAEEAFEALQAALTAGYFAGSRFERLDVS